MRSLTVGHRNRAALLLVAMPSSAALRGRTTSTSSSAPTGRSSSTSCPGERVLWTNVSARTHTVTSDDGPLRLRGRDQRQPLLVPVQHTRAPTTTTARSTQASSGRSTSARSSSTASRLRRSRTGPGRVRRPHLDAREAGPRPAERRRRGFQTVAQVKAAAERKLEGDDRRPDDRRLSRSLRARRRARPAASS